MGRASRRRAERRLVADQTPALWFDDQGEDRVEVVASGLRRRPPYRAPRGSAEPALSRLAELSSARLALEESIQREVVALVRLGATWGTIGRALGVSRQAARQRYGAHAR